MNVDVFDTYVARPDNPLMHFDIIVPSGTTHEAVIGFGQHYLEQVEVEGGEVKADRCRFCHVESATPEMVEAIERQGFYILAMEGCPPIAAND